MKMNIRKKLFFFSFKFNHLENEMMKIKKKKNSIIFIIIIIIINKIKMIISNLFSLFLLY